MARQSDHNRLVELCEAIMAKLAEGEYLSDKQEALMEFVAEWTHSMGGRELWLGYRMEEGGDDLYDPLVTIELTKNIITARVRNEFIGTDIKDDDLQFTTAFVAEVFNRHFKLLDQSGYIRTAKRLGG